MNSCSPFIFQTTMKRSQQHIQSSGNRKFIFFGVIGGKEAFLKFVCTSFTFLNGLSTHETLLLARGKECWRQGLFRLQHASWFLSFRMSHSSTVELELCLWMRWYNMIRFREFQNSESHERPPGARDYNGRLLFDVYDAVKTLFNGYSTTTEPVVLYSDRES